MGLWFLPVSLITIYRPHNFLLSLILEIDSQTTRVSTVHVILEMKRAMWTALCVQWTDEIGGCFVGFTGGIHIDVVTGSWNGIQIELTKMNCF